MAEDGAFRLSAPVSFGDSRLPRVFTTATRPPEFTLENYRFVLFDPNNREGMAKAFFNTLTVTIPATIVLFLEGKALVAVLFLAFCTAQGLFIENVVKTRLMGSAMRMHDLLVFLSVLGGIGSFGLIGLVYGPLCAMLFIALADLYANRYRPRLALRFARRSTARAADA